MKRINQAIAISFTSAVVSFVGLGFAASPAFAATCGSPSDGAPFSTSGAVQNNTQCTSPGANATATNNGGTTSLSGQTATAWANNQVTQTNAQSLQLDAVTAPTTLFILPSGLGTVQDNHPSLTSSATANATNNGNTGASKSDGAQTANAGANTNSSQSNSQTTSLTNTTTYLTPPSTTSQQMANSATSNAVNNAGNGTFTSQSATQTANATAAQANTQTLTTDKNATIVGVLQQNGQKVNQSVSGTATNNTDNGNVGNQSANSYTQGNTNQSSNQNLTVNQGSTVVGDLTIVDFFVNQIGPLPFTVTLPGAIQKSAQTITNNPQSTATNSGNQADNLGGQTANAYDFIGLNQTNSQTGTIAATTIEPNLGQNGPVQPIKPIMSNGVNFTHIQNNQQTFFPDMKNSATSTATASNNGQSADISGTQTANAYAGFSVMATDQGNLLVPTATSTQSNTQTFSANQGHYLFNIIAVG